MEVFGSLAHEKIKRKGYFGVDPNREMRKKNIKLDELLFFHDDGLIILSA